MRSKIKQKKIVYALYDNNFLHYRRTKDYDFHETVSNRIL